MSKSRVRPWSQCSSLVSTAYEQTHMLAWMEAFFVCASRIYIQHFTYKLTSKLSILCAYSLHIHFSWTVNPLHKLVKRQLHSHQRLPLHNLIPKVLQFFLKCFFLFCFFNVLIWLLWPNRFLLEARFFLLFFSKKQRLGSQEWSTTNRGIQIDVSPFDPHFECDRQYSSRYIAFNILQEIPMTCLQRHTKL